MLGADMVMLRVRVADIFSLVGIIKFKSGLKISMVFAVAVRLTEAAIKNKKLRL